MFAQMLVLRVQKYLVKANYSFKMVIISILLPHFYNVIL